MSCSFCLQDIVHTSVSFPCKHVAHLICCLERQAIMCPECNDASVHVVDLGLKENNTDIAQLLLKTVKPVKSNWGFQRTPKFYELMKEHPAALLATHHPLDFVQGNAKLEQVADTYKLDTLLRHGFTLKHFDAMCDSKATTLRELYSSYGMSETNKAFSMNAEEIQTRCPTLQSLMSLNLSTEEIRSLGMGLDLFMKRGATLQDLLQVPLYKDMDSSDSSFAEFSTAWTPSYEQLETLGCTDQATVEELTDWDFCSVPQQENPEPEHVKEVLRVKPATLNAFKLNF